MDTSQPGPARVPDPPAVVRRSRLLVGLAVLGAAGATAALVQLNGTTSTTAAPPAAAPSTVDVADAASQSLLALPQADQLTQAAGQLAQPAAPVQAAVAAAPVPAAAPAPAQPQAAHGEMAPATSASACVAKEALQPILDHVKAAHLETSPGQQVSDALNLDQYVKTHTVWLENVLSPVMNGSADKTVTDTLAPIWAHVQSAHLETSPAQQVSDALNLDQYVKTHTVWLEQVLTPLLTQASC
ncbi:MULTISPECIES: hypothetical protein [Amycolatopsis]|uniref:Uncharacterized protein n=2 Tax=Amycolatopsis TaxID=1813 RepID=A0A1I4BYK2_9PSEU|nr:hypothetical protein [Amycolatopsis sacchari]SFK73735.1 hypothetical protein SAMN05421835_13130 [Amycolatopsis sacchari]